MSRIHLVSVLRCHGFFLLVSQIHQDSSASMDEISYEEVSLSQLDISCNIEIDYNNNNNTPALQTGDVPVLTLTLKPKKQLYCSECQY